MYLGLNVGGQPFLLLVSSIEKRPHGLLYELCSVGHEQRMELCDGYLRTRDEYFFDRPASVFELVAAYYRTGRIHESSAVCSKLLNEELRFWKLDKPEHVRCRCSHVGGQPESEQPNSRPVSFRRRSSTSNRRNQSLDHEDGMHTLLALPENRMLSKRNSLPANDKSMNAYAAQVLPIRTAFTVEMEEERLPAGDRMGQYRQFVWHALQRPRDYMLGQLFAITSLIFVLVSVVTVCIESYRKYNFPCADVLEGLIKNETSSKVSAWSALFGSVDKKLKSHDVDYQGIGDTIVIIDILCTIWFTVEFAVYLWAAPKRLAFLLSPYGMVDILSTVPFYIEICFHVLAVACPDNSENLWNALVFMRILRALKSFRIFKLAQFSHGLQVLFAAFSAMSWDLAMVFLYFAIMSYFFGTLVFYAEYWDDNPKTHFTGVPISTWWALVTLTTLGYGDMVPQTVIGKIIASAATVCGCVFLAFPVSIMVQHFTDAYDEIIPPWRKSENAPTRTGGGVFRLLPRFKTMNRKQGHVMTQRKRSLLGERSNRSMAPLIERTDTTTQPSLGHRKRSVLEDIHRINVINTDGVKFNLG